MNKTIDKNINDYKMEIRKRVEKYNRPLNEFKNRILKIKKEISLRKNKHPVKINPIDNRKVS